MEENKNNYSVYYHYNPANDKYYIGITKQEPERRWNNGYGYHKLLAQRYANMVGIILSTL